MKRSFLFALLAITALAALVAGFAPALAAPAAQETRPVIVQPAADSAVRDVVQIIGTATHPQFQRYELYYAPSPVPSDQSWIFIGDAHNNQQPLGLLGTWDSRSVPDGAYALRVRVVKADGNYIDSDAVRVVVANTRPAETPTPEVTETPAVEMPPTAAPGDAPVGEAPAVVEQPTAAGEQPAVVAVPTIAPTPTAEGATAATTEEPDASPTARTTRTFSASSSGDDDSGESATVTASQLFSGSRLMDTARKAALYTAAAFLAAGLFFGIKGILVWLWYRIKP